MTAASHDERMMRRAIELARHGLGTTSPNPMVGAVIALPDGTVIGEGWHRRYGEGHAEVNAVASVADRSLLPQATIYVTLEPCSHYGKTPPCARLIIDSGIRRVVVGTLDPAPWVAGKGVAMLRDAGVEVVTGVLEEECREVNPAFMTAHTLARPWVTLKWAQSADGFIDRERNPSEPAARFSTALSTMLVHRLRSIHDAILVGSGTVLSDRPSLTTRAWPGRDAIPAIADRRRRIAALPPSLAGRADTVIRLDDATPAQMLATLREKGVTSVLVEGGTSLLQSFIDAGMYDFIRVETAPLRLYKGVPAPRLGLTPAKIHEVGTNRIDLYGQIPWWADFQ
ncbi:bifunctional diaminohydroxyphosphoribosylaminopyrimidine deaminase/5-amino-6-(5-phosphoribosylamino)uracil reductase RibD [uncultured Muribaculum sp.]|uniref:bifunctional diaminohydroxyphosphoribosylaminopyrimidine deaminase/5-amino-6-(5-phosphoribosylamino)uracil reductase RibD n=1 Tax=uncultured Muribaculum sp. TaxID=1918613 RepID=UPI0026356090|nr:bifunctional diaminohydroxyphosphoribosylaminopyrimidine deaminase/5-amino-6-(5-phosphoribosylamino)uracil reductase RibD [uncultured Muribaculum sp.]